MSDESMPLQGVEDIILNFIKEFVSRLGIVQEALPQLHPRLIWRRWCRDNPHIPRTQATYRKLTKQHPQLGLWKKEWKYFVHGMGCRLIHIHTDEPLEWDAGNKRCFDKNWFVNWVQWRLQNGSSNKYVSNVKSFCTTLKIDCLRKIVFPILEVLSRKHHLSGEIKGHRYVLLE